MTYESRAYQKRYDDEGFPPEPFVVIVAEGTHDVSRLVSLLNGAPINIEQLQLGKRVVQQVRQHDGGQAALRLLAEHGGPDFLNPSLPGLDESRLQVLRELAAGETVRQIARRRGVVPHAVSARLRRAREAVGVRTTAQLLALCVQLGLVEPGPLRGDSRRGGAR